MYSVNSLANQRQCSGSVGAFFNRLISQDIVFQKVEARASGVNTFKSNKSLLMHSSRHQIKHTPPTDLHHNEVAIHLQENGHCVVLCKQICARSTLRVSWSSVEEDVNFAKENLFCTASPNYCPLLAAILVCQSWICDQWFEADWSL